MGQRGGAVAEENAALLGLAAAAGCCACCSVFCSPEVDFSAPHPGAVPRAARPGAPSCLLEVSPIDFPAARHSQAYPAPSAGILWAQGRGRSPRTSPGCSRMPRAAQGSSRPILQSCSRAFAAPGGRSAGLGRAHQQLRVLRGSCVDGGLWPWEEEEEEEGQKLR